MRRSRFFGAVFLVAVSLICGLFSSAIAQPAPPQPPDILGQAVATCFSGYNASYVVKDDYVAGIVNVHVPVGPGVNWPAPMYHGPLADPWKASKLGQVFGIAIDIRNNIYLTATTSYGVNTPSNSYRFGAAGSGGVYQIDGITGNINTNFITTVPYNTFSPNPASAIGTKTIPNGSAAIKPGLGDICYDRTHDKLFVTNFEDGIIYRINPLTQKIDAVYDPVVLAGPGGTLNPAMVADNGTSAGFAPRGDRIWGIAYNPLDNRVYYSVWMEDLGNYTAGTYNIIRSIGLDASGNFNPPSDDKFEIKVPNYPSATYSSPVADIAFASNGNILLGERSMYSDDAPSAHQSRALEFTGASPLWLPSAANFFVGEGGSQANAAGGVDYGYKSYDTVKRENVGCDSTVWTSGDYLRNDPGFVPYGWIYGLQRTARTGNTASNVGTTSYFVDLNGVSGTYDKTQIGDVEVYRNPCGDIAQIPPCEKKSVRMQFVQGSNKECCIKLTLINSAANFWTSFSASSITPGVTLSGAIGPSGWNVTNDGTTAVWTPYATYVPTGNTDSLAICLYSLVNPPQQVVFTWYGVDGTVCRDTIRTDCSKMQPPVPHCASVLNPRLLCKTQSSGSNTYQLTMSVINNSTFSTPTWGSLPAYHMEVTPITPGVTIVPNTVTFSPPLGYGIISPTMTFTVTVPSNMAAGTQLCFYFKLHGQHYLDANGNAVDKWCCPPDSICFTLPPCKDCCEGFRKIIDTKEVVSSNGVTTLSTNITAGPKPIIKATATIISADIKRFGKCATGSWQPVAGEIINPPASWNGLPIQLTPPPFATAPPAPYREVLYGTVPSGVVMSGSPLSLQLQFPNPPSPFLGCYDSLRFCVRYTFTDTSCVTCDTVVCYQIRRKGSLIVIDGGTLDLAWGKIDLSSAAKGKFTLTPPRLPADASPQDNYHLVGFSLTPEFGARIVSPPWKEVDSVVYVALDPGTSKSYDLTYENFAQLTTIRHKLGLYYVFNSNPRDTLRAEQILVGRVPGEKGGDAVGEEAVKLTNVRTFALYFRSTNKSERPIGSLDLSVSDGNAILAVGPTEDSVRVHLAAVAYDRNGARSRQALAPNEGRRPAVISAGSTISPIFLTVAGGTEKMLTVHFTSRDSSGATVSDDSVTLQLPLSAVGRIDDPNVALAITGLYPNPTANSTSIQFAIPNSEVVSIEIRDELGRLISPIMTNEHLVAGEHVIVLQTATMPSGNYFVTIIAGDHAATRSLKIMR